MKKLSQFNDQPFASIIIPCKKIDAYTRECVDHCRQLDYQNREIILLPDGVSKEIEGVNIVSTGVVSPGTKRNIGVARSTGEICAFIDSDAYPRRDWLTNAVKYLKESGVAAVGGPGLTPENDSLMQKAGGYVLSSFMVGSLSKRYKSKGALESDDVHSCNFIACKSALIEANGWSEKYWPGEDTLICRAIKGLGKKLVEAPDVVVFHHRRPLFIKHLKQVSSYGLHRGFFARKFSENSLRPLYFAPSFLVAFLFLGSALSFLYYSVFFFFSLSVAAYLLLCLVVSFIEAKGFKMIPLIWSGIILTHLFYGVSFIMGFFKSDLKR